MLAALLKHSASMLVSPQRMAGRSWFAELLVRTTRDIFVAANEQELSKFRAQIDKGVGYHPAVAKASMVMRDVAGVECMMLSPKEGVESDNVVVYFHGGGYIVGSAEGHTAILAQLAISTKGLVIAPNYRLAPEHPFPAPQDDCLKVAEAVLKTYKDKRVTIAGDSAGGALAINTALSIAKNEAAADKTIDNLVLLSPWVEPGASGGSLVSNEKNDFLITAFLDDCIDDLMQGQDANNPSIDFAKVDLSPLPKTLVQYGGGEIFYDQIHSFCERAQAAGVDLTAQNYETQFHVFQLFSAALKDAKVAMAEIASFIKAG